MKLKFFLKAQSDFDALPDHYKSLYSKTADGWMIDIEGAASAERLNEFRDNNTALKQQVEAWTKTGLTVEQATELKAKAADLEEGKLFKKEGLEAAVQARITAMKADYDKQLADAKAINEKAMGELATIKIDAALIEAGTGLGLLPTAHQDLVFRGRSIFKLEDGKVVAYGTDGKPLHGKGAEPLSVKEWVEGLVPTAAHLFAPNSGGGAPGGGAGAGTRGPGAANPFKKESWNLTEQGRLFKADAATARRLAAEAGVNIPATA